ncbi:hypothetical protein [Corynebacterium glyciniphilum]|uniref:hypothetical protein n=1 Tax=Corynebacterium glyciniphilum TaxID=1404244 RepID=UPI0011AB3365|nr:hypothetical protein [Corynebacterium glyciniphilum]
MPTWSEMRGLIQCGCDAPLRATVTLWGEPDGSQYGWVMGGERIASLALGPGTYRLARDNRSRAVSELDGTPRLVDDGEHAVVMQGASPLEATGCLALTSSAGVLFSRDLLNTVLDRVYPAGPVEQVTHDGRAAWLVPGLPTRHYKLPEMPRSMVVDAETGVVVRIDNGDGGGELTDLECPSSLSSDDATWGTVVSEKYGVPVAPEPWRPRGAEGEGDSLHEGAAAVPQPPVGEFTRFLDSYSRPAPAPVPDGHRSLLVVGALPVDPSDSLPTWRRGTTIDMVLGFMEVVDSGAMDYSTLVEPCTVTAWAEPVQDGEPVDQRMNRRGFRWQTVLRGDGWTALWDADRPTVGYVKVTGVFYTGPDYGHPYSPTRGMLTRIRLDCDLRHQDAVVPGVPVPAIDVIDGRDLPYWDEEPWFGSVDRLLFTVDLDAAAPPVVKETHEPQGVLDFAVSRDGETTTLWRPEGGALPALWRTDLDTGDTGRVLLPVVVHQYGHPPYWEFPAHGGVTLRVRCAGGEFLIDRDGTVQDAPPESPVFPGIAGIDDEPTHVRRHPDGGWVVVYVEWDAGPDGGCFQHLGRLSDDGQVTWVESLLNVPSVSLVIADGWIFTGMENVLTVRDSDLGVVVRRQLPWHVESLVELGPWLGIDRRGRRPGIVGADDPEECYSLLDPETFESVLDIDIDPGLTFRTYVRWFDGELWFADGRLRVFTPQVDGSWVSREIRLPG